MTSDDGSFHVRKEKITSLSPDQIAIAKQQSCPLCAVMGAGLTCTLHGGHMTATEIKMRREYEIVGGRWVRRKHDASVSEWVFDGSSFVRDGEVIPHDEVLALLNAPPPTLRVWATTDFDGFYPVGTCALAVAATEADARETLALVIREHGLEDPKDTFDVQEIDTTCRAAWVLLDGDC